MSRYDSNDFKYSADIRREETSLVLDPTITQPRYVLRMPVFSLRTAQAFKSREAGVMGWGRGNIHTNTYTEGNILFSTLTDMSLRPKEELPVPSQLAAQETDGVDLQVVRLGLGWEGHSCDLLLFHWFLTSQHL